MGKKRKPNGRKLQKSQPEELDSAQRVITSYEDVAGSEDEFHINRDKIFLEDGPQRKRQRRLQEDDAFLEASDEEILDFDEDLDEASSSEYASDLGTQTRPDLGNGTLAQPSRSQREHGSPSEAEEASEGWGTSKREYYDADIIETEADALEEEAEAIKLQKKHLQSMAEADFGFDESEWLAASASADEQHQDQGGALSEVLPDLQLIESMSTHEKEEILGLRYPEFKPLAEEFLELRQFYGELATTAAEARKAWEKSLARVNEAKIERLDVVPMAITRFNALSIYLGCLAMYFAIFTSGSGEHGRAMPKSPQDLREHSIMESLIKCRKLWHTVSNIEINDAFSIGIGREDEKPASTIASASQKIHADRSTHMETTLSDRRATNGGKVKKAAKKSIGERGQQAESIRKSEPLEPASSMTGPTESHSMTDSSIKSVDDDDIDFDREDVPKPRGDVENTKRKKSLQFYTSQIAQKLNRRETAGRDAGGDADIPYRERLKDRQARLLAQAEARGKKKPISTEELGGESDEDDGAVAKKIREGGDGLDLYDQVASLTKKKKAEKATRAAAYKEAEKQGASVRFVEEVDADGKRAIGYKIEKNKGLTPKRRKEVRNPRVKKRNKYEEKMKKLGSIRQVYKGGEGRGGYGGELTGIKTNLVRSVKF